MNRSGGGPADQSAKACHERTKGNPKEDDDLVAFAKFHTVASTLTAGMRVSGEKKEARSLLIGPRN